MSSGNCSPFLGNCQPTDQQTPPPPSVPQYALLGFLFIFVMAVFIVIFLIRTRTLCLNSRRLRALRLGSNRVQTAGTDLADGTVPVSPAEPLIRAAQGLDPSFVQTLPLFSYREGGIAELAGLKGIGDCSVCLGEFQVGQSVRLLPGCKHFFHPECVDTWLLSHTSCPLCRTDVQGKKQSSLKRVLSLLGSRYQVEDSADARAGTTPPSDILAVPQVPPAAPVSGQLVTPAAPHSLEGDIPQAGGDAAHTGEVRVSMAQEDRATSNQADPGPEQTDQQSASMLGHPRYRRSGSESMRWAAPDPLVLDTTTPRPLGRDHVTLRQRPFFERRHSFTEMLRKSIRRDPSLIRSLSRPMDPQSSTPFSADTIQVQDLETGPPLSL